MKQVNGKNKCYPPKFYIRKTRPGGQTRGGLVKITLEPEQLEVIKEMLDKVVKVAEKIATELKRANDLKEKENNRP